jgi:uncharacterized protein YgbK (DUF1537 family)
LLQSNRLHAAVSEIARQIQAEHDRGRCVIAHTSRGPNDRRITALRQSGERGRAMATQLATILGRILHEVLGTCRLRRVGVIGGDTSCHVASALGIDALEMVGPLTPGAPLCLARSREADIDGLEITFKGGQVGHDDFFATLLRGRPDGADRKTAVAKAKQ